MRQLCCRDLRAGDIMLKASDASFLSNAIQFLQSASGGQNTQIVHAGLMFDSTYIIEAQASGIQANDMRVQNRPYGYIVFRCTNPNIAAGAATCAKMMFDIHKRTGALKYNLGGAGASILGGPGKAKGADEMEALLDRILQGKSNRFFCSQFVVYVYQFVAEQNGIPGGRLFNFSDAKVPPTTLSAALSGHSMFQEVGYMMPNER